jgi:hypothetical protein
MSDDSAHSESKNKIPVNPKRLLAPNLNPNPTLTPLRPTDLMPYLASISTTSAAATWGILVLLAFIGWGRSIAILLKLPEQNWSSAAALGLGFTICMGGLLNLLAIVSPASLITYVVCGVALFLLGLKDSPKNVLHEIKLQLATQTPLQKLSLSVIFLLLLLRFFGEAAPPYYFFQAHDDYQAYLAHPIKMLQTGGIGDDPFSERRLSSLGGQAFLQALPGAMIGPEHFRLMDSGLALLILLGLTVEFARRQKLPPKSIYLLLLWLLLAIPPDINITTMLVGSVLFFYLFLLLSSQNATAFDPGRMLAIGLTVAAICACKSTLVPAVVMILAFHFLSPAISLKSGRTIPLELALAGVVAVLLLVPWMFLMWKSSGTLLFPILGKGYHATAYGVKYETPLTFARAFARVFYSFNNPFYFLLLALPLTCWRQSFPEKRLFGSFALGSICALVIIMLSIESFPTDVYRYSYPFLLVVITLSFTSLLRESASARIKGAYIVIGLLLLSLGLNARSISQRYYLYAKVRTVGYREASIASNQERMSAFAAQAVVLPSAPILARLEKNFLLDFDRNPIFIIDLPGGSSLPPGMPLKFDPESLARYFQSKGLRYIAYSYASGANFSRKTHQDRLSPAMPQWFKVQAQLVFTFQDNLDALGKSRRRLYDDGRAFVLDLGQAAR